VTQESFSGGNGGGSMRRKRKFIEGAGKVTATHAQKDREILRSQIVTAKMGIVELCILR
jgi:hypothetical protein